VAGWVLFGAYSSSQHSLAAELAQFYHRLPAAIVTCGDTMRQQLMSNGFPPAQLVNIPTGIDFTAFQPRRARADVRAALGVSDLRQLC